MNLTDTAAHYRRMASAEHKPECMATAAAPRRWCDRLPKPMPACPGCNSQTDRDLFARLADEIEVHLAPQPDLFGELSPEPTTPSPTPAREVEGQSEETT